MSRAARSLFLFGIYVLVVGVAFVAVPGRIVTLLGLPPLAVGWGRVLGFLALVIGTYDIVGSCSESAAYMRTSVFARLGFSAATALLFVAGEMPAPVLLFSAVDLAGATWTAVELKRAGTALFTTS